MWPEEDRDGPLGLAVSGGPDSLALMLLAGEALPGAVAVASVDHGLRPEAAGEIALVEAACRERDIPFTALKIEVARGNLQARAREARYAALGHWARDAGCGALATAHHADDQAETLLMRLARGSGLSGLAGVRAHGRVPGSDIALIRPLLGWRKADLEGVVEACGLEAARDPTNEDLAFDRARVRQHLAEHDWLDAQALAASADHLAEAWRAIEWYAQIDWEEMVHREDEPHGPTFRYYANVPRAIQVETVRRIVAALGGQVSRAEAGRAADRLWRFENASLGGVLGMPGTERVEKVGVEMRVWRFRPEPARRVH
ncbi:MAG: tRNA lysidine(34) synthetase TilS [Erythrobacter sp.]|uniref:tRNA lysidine(34) synthetase TilS n=1 Tax=Erythrobacter sp. TaxID=1042 RepID=UPI0032EB25A2